MFYSIDQAIVDAVKPVLVVGYGYMGRTYVNMMLETGFAPRDIIVVDRDSGRLAECLKKHPGVVVFDRLDTALEAKPRAVLNITNSPEHAKVMQFCLGSGVKNHFVEKPLGLPKDLSYMAALRQLADLKVGCGYLINFSGAMNCLFHIMRQESLYVMEGRGIWGKDRCGDTRPTAGDLEDEATHALATILAAIAYNQNVQSIAVRGALSFLPFANASAQQQAHCSDDSYPLEPTSTSHVAMAIETSMRRRVLATVTSSFISFGQERRIELVLGKDGAITRLARLDFDVKGKDTFSLRSAGSKDAPLQLSSDSDSKLSTQLKAFFVWVAGGEKDPRLVDLAQAVSMVDIGKQAQESNL